MKKIIVTITLFLTNIPFATAHIQESVLTGMLAGIQHPLTGIDHLVVLIAIGMLAARGASTRKKLLLPLVFFNAMFVGFAIAQVQQFIVAAESIIVASTWVLDAFLFLGNSYRNALLIILMALFGVAHGHAHGIEVIGSPVMFVTGMLFTCNVLIAIVLMIFSLVRVHTRKSNEKYA